MESGDLRTTVATQPRQLHYSNNLSNKKKKKCSDDCRMAASLCLKLSKKRRQEVFHPPSRIQKNRVAKDKSKIKTKLSKNPLLPAHHLPPSPHSCVKHCRWSVRSTLRRPTLFTLGSGEYYIGKYSFFFTPFFKVTPRRGARVHLFLLPPPIPSFHPSTPPPSLQIYFRLHIWWEPT